MSKQQTAVEWLIEQLTKQPIENINDEYWFGIIGEAKELERQQIVYANIAGLELGNYHVTDEAEQYYNNKYGQ